MNSSARIPALAVLLTAIFALGAQAQPAATKESTDPGKAAAVERAAAALKARPVQPTAGLVRAKTATGEDLLSGGVTVGDRVAMHAEQGRYSLWVATVGKPSGAYLADVDLHIVRVKDRATVLERKLEGPWLMVALPAGSYDITGTFLKQGASTPQILKTRASVGKSGVRQAVLRFDSDAKVDPDMQSPLKGNPFAKPTASGSPAK